MNLKGQLVTLTKMIGWRIGQKKLTPSQNDIMLFASRRGGSTWLMEVICSNQNVRWVDQPFSLFTGPGGMSHQMPVFECSEAIHMEDAETQDVMREYVDGIFTGRININSEWRIFSKRFWCRKDRTIVKIVQAKSIAEWLSTEFPAKPLVLFRHPISQALSVMKAEWRNHSRAFLNHHWFRSNVLGESVAQECDQLLLRGAPLTRYAMNCALENLILLRTIRSGKLWFSLTYEDCLLRPDVVVESLSSHFNLGDPAAMQSRMAVASRTTGLTHDKSFKHSNNQVSRWMEKCSSSEKKECQQLLDLLKIDLYSADDPAPKFDLLASKETLPHASHQSEANN